MLAYIEADVGNPKCKTDIADLITSMGYPIVGDGWRINGIRAFYCLENVTDGDEFLRNLITKVKEKDIEATFFKRVLFYKT